jgi:DNA invertase Pin-like site-specific DNA recombinase
MIVGYTRCSTLAQDHSIQLLALEQVGVERIFTDTISGTVESRTGLKEALEFLREGDQLVVYSVSRLSRSLKHLLGIIEDLNSRKIGFRSLRENFDLNTPLGVLCFSMMGAFAQLEKDMIVQRTSDGRALAKARGKTFGRPNKSAAKADLLKLLIEQGTLSNSEMAEKLQLSHASFYRLKKQVLS